jgi:hypothetical protein
VNAEGSCGLGVVEGHESELVEGTEEVGSKGTCEVEAKGLGGPVAGNDYVKGGAELVAREVGAPRGISSREEVVYIYSSSRTCAVVQ